MTKFEIHVDSDLCMGTGECEHYAPGTFKIGDDGVSTVVSHDSDDEDAIVEAARRCPNFAITVLRDGRSLL